MFRKRRWWGPGGLAYLATGLVLAAQWLLAVRDARIQGRECLLVDNP
jgi:hypothetical protein